MNRFVHILMSKAACLLGLMVLAGNCPSVAEARSAAGGYGGATWGMPPEDVNFIWTRTLRAEHSRTLEGTSYHDSLRDLGCVVTPRFFEGSLYRVNLSFDIGEMVAAEVGKVYDNLARSITGIYGAPDHDSEWVATVATLGKNVKSDSWRSDKTTVFLFMGLVDGHLRFDLVYSARDLERAVLGLRNGQELKTTWAPQDKLNPPQELLKIDPNALPSWRRHDPTRYAPTHEYVPEQDEFVAVEKMPVVLRSMQPIYPESAMHTGIQGTVWIQALVDEKGVVRNVRVAKSSGSDVGFDEAAIVAAYRVEYQPAIKEGVPVCVWRTYRVNFSFDD